MSKIIIITDTEEPGAFDSTSSMAVVTIDAAQVYRFQVLTTELKKNHPDFSELRFWGSNAEYYDSLTPDQLLDALSKIAEEDATKAKPRITQEQVDEIHQLYGDNGSFKWPSHIEFNLRDLLNMTAEDYGEEPWEDEPESMRVDIEEIVAEDDEFRCAAYYGDQQVYTKYIPYSWALDEAAV
jgi:hypothetical protein